MEFYSAIMHNDFISFAMGREEVIMLGDINLFHKDSIAYFLSFLESKWVKVHGSEQGVLWIWVGKEGEGLNSNREGE
jgi:hypothetical protein